MAVPFQSLRKWFVIAAVVLVVIVAAFFVVARWQVRHIEETAKAKLGIEVKSATSGFRLSKSEAGRTLFTIQASKAVEYKEGGRAELHDVSIFIYGRDSTPFHHIYRSHFIYHPPP